MIRNAPEPHCSRCCPTNPLPQDDAPLCRDEEPMFGDAATRRLPTVCVLPKGHDDDHSNGSGTTWRYDTNPTRPLSSLAPTVAVHRTRPSSYAAWAAEQPDEPGKVRRQRRIAAALGYTAEIAAPGEPPRRDYVTDRWAQEVRGRMLDAFEGEVAEARAAGYADGYHAALQAARAAVHAEQNRDASTYGVWLRVRRALEALLDAAPPLHPTNPEPEPDPDPDTITIPRPRITTGPSSMTYDKGTAHYLRDAAIRVRTQRYWGSGVTACVSDLLDAAADALDPPTED